MNQYNQHITEDTKGIQLWGEASQIINANSISWKNDVKTGGKTFAVWLEFDKVIEENTSGANILQFRRSDDSTVAIMIFNLVRISGETGNTSRMSINARFGNINRLCFGSTVIVPSQKYLMVWQTTGTEYKFWINEAYETITPSTAQGGINDGKWCGDLGEVMANGRYGSNTLNTGGHSKFKMYASMYWDKLLTSTELTEVYNAGTVKDPTHLYTSLGGLKYYVRSGERETQEGSITTVFESIVPNDHPSIGMTTANIVDNRAKTISDDLVGYWRLRADANDYSSFANHGTPTGITYTGGYANFSGTNSYVTIPDNDRYSFIDAYSDVPMSIIFLVSVTSVPVGPGAGYWLVNKRLTSTNREWQFTITSPSSSPAGARAAFLSPTSSPNNTISIGESWVPVVNQKYAICFTYSGSEIKEGIRLYRDGTLVGSTTNQSLGTYDGMVNGSSQVVLGTPAWSLGAGNSHKGTLSGVGIWKGRSLTPSEVSSYSTILLSGGNLI